MVKAVRHGDMCYNGEGVQHGDAGVQYMVHSDGAHAAAPERVETGALCGASHGLLSCTAGPKWPRLRSGAQRAATHEHKREGALSRRRPALPLPGRHVWSMSMLLRHLEELREVRGELEQRGGDALHLRREVEVSLVGRHTAQDVAQHL